MSGKKSGTKDTDRIKFFKLEKSKVTPAFPDEKTREPKNENTMTQAGKEPVFSMDSDDYSREFSLVDIEPKVSPEMESLKEKVADISQRAGDQDLTSEQSEILRKYISLKEAEVRDLRDQQRQYVNHFKKITTELEKLTNKNRETISELETLRRKDESAREEKQELKNKFDEELALIRADYEDRLKKSGNYESQVDDLNNKREEWREKIKEDLKRIKLKERELENKHELLKRDMQALLDSKDKHVLELKQKNDALELEMESLEERLRKANSVLGVIDSKKKRLVETMRLAITLLEAIDTVDLSSDVKDISKKAG